MRAVISYEDVASAAEAIEAQGVKPTIDRIRDRLRSQGFGQGGSATTVSVHFNRWKEGRPAHGGRPLPSVSDPLWIAAQNVRDEVRREIQAEFDLMESKVRNDARQEVESAFSQTRIASAELTLAEQRVRDKQEEAKRQSDRADAAVREAAKVQTLYSKALADLNEQRQKMESIVARSDASVTAASSAQAHLAIELERARTESTRWQNELTRTNEQYSVLQKSLLENESRNANERQQLTHRIGTLEDSLNVVMVREAEATRELSVQMERAMALERKTAQLEDGLASARKAESRWQDEAIKLSHLLEQLLKETQVFRAAQSAQGGSVESLAKQIQRIEKLILQKQNTNEKGGI